MGGPFWARKDEGAWSIPKGELLDGEDPLAGARREFAEELGHPPPEGEILSLGEIRQKAGKRVIAFAVRGDFDPADLVPGTFEMQWPPRSGRTAVVPRDRPRRVVSAASGGSEDRQGTSPAPAPPLRDDAGMSALGDLRA